MSVLCKHFSIERDPLCQKTYESHLYLCKFRQHRITDILTICSRGSFLSIMSGITRDVSAQGVTSRFYTLGIPRTETSSLRSFG